MQFQAELRQPGPELNQEPPRVLLVLKTDDKVVSEPHDDHLAASVMTTPPHGPEVQNVMQVHVREQRRRRRSLRCPGAFAPGLFLHDSRGQPLADQPQDPFVRDPVPEKLLQPAPIKLTEKPGISAAGTQFTFFRSIPTASASSASWGLRPGRNP